MIEAKWVRRLGVNVSTSVLGVVIAAACALLVAPAPSASAQPCSDVEVVFARGTGEPPGVGGVGQAFVDALRAQVGGKSLDVYPVNYLASNDFGAGIEFAKTVVDGVKDAGAHIQSTAASCPNTRIVLGGYSQGAAVAGYVTSASVPQEVPAAFRSYLPQPIPAEVVQHVAAVVLFGTPSDEFLRPFNAPPIVIGPLYAGKTDKLCAPGDTICDGTPGSQPSLAHGLYPVNGMVNDGAAFAVSHL